ncbi:hypothetical protein [Candidatus Avelusimicrobium caledoniensis]|uniref:hypothetical protein n=1 Tax=Candidatus Avelusimicrobium caledoniensis TaxID=3416220 RepID=UPI003D121FCF
MNEFIFSAAWKVIALVFAAGVVWGELKAIRKDIARLEQKQDKYNHLQERVYTLEGEMRLCQNLARPAKRD